MDHKYQSQGYGKQAFSLILEKIRQTYPGIDIYLSVYDENVRAISMYKKFGFEYTGELDTQGEKIMKCTKRGVY